MYALITHWTSVKEAPRNRPIAGSETATNHDQRRDKQRDQENAELFCSDYRFSSDIIRCLSATT
jgi:hypothetical protein